MSFSSKSKLSLFTDSQFDNGAQFEPQKTTQHVLTRGSFSDSLAQKEYLCLQHIDLIVNLYNQENKRKYSAMPPPRLDAEPYSKGVVLYYRVEVWTGRDGERSLG